MVNDLQYSFNSSWLDENANTFLTVAIESAFAINL